MSAVSRRVRQRPLVSADAPAPTCKRGHDLADAYVTPAGYRQCGQCRKERDAGVAQPVPHPYGPSTARRAYQRAWYAAHADALRARARRIYREGVLAVRGEAA